MPDVTQVARIEAGLIASWERLCGLLPDAAIYRHDGLVLAVPGVGDPPINGAVPEPGVDPEHPAEAVEVLEGLCAAHGARLLVDLAGGAHPGFEAALRHAGLRPGVRRRGMVAPLAPASPGPFGAVRAPADAPVPDTRLRDARPDDVVALRRLEQECFGLAAAVTERFLPERALEDPDYRTVVAERFGAESGSPSPPSILAKAHGHLRNGALGITGVATTVRARRRGLARALVVELLAGARERGATSSWLLAELPAAGVYLGVGFQDVAEWWLWSRL
jgi:ribosomal protein S18 acetylase RimI-like enzyme